MARGEEGEENFALCGIKRGGPIGTVFMNNISGIYGDVPWKQGSVKLRICEGARIREAN